MPLSPCCPYHPAEGTYLISQSAVRSAAFAHLERARPSELFSVEATYGFTFVTARQLAHHPKDGLVSQLRQFRFLHQGDSSYGALTFAPAGLAPAEHASLRWTH